MSNANLSFSDFVVATVKEDVARAIENRRRKYLDWSQRWLEESVRYTRVADLYDGWLLRCVARRIKGISGEEFFSFFAIHARSKAFARLADADEQMSVRGLLAAFAVRDARCVQQFLWKSKFALHHGHSDGTGIDNGIYTLLVGPASQ